MKIDKEDFDAWWGNPTTEAFIKCCGVWASNARELWVQSSWEGGVNNDNDLWRLKGQAEVLRDIQGMTATTIEETLSDDQSKT
jgi:hypothetical protein